MLEMLCTPWPWYVAGPLIGLVVPGLLLLENKQFGLSANLRHICAAVIPGKIKFFRYDWKKELWNLVFILGIFIGGFTGSYILKNPNPIGLSERTLTDLRKLGIEDFSEMVPREIFSWSNFLTTQGFIVLVIGGFLIGFGSRYAGGCTSGHAISGLSNFQLPSLIAVIGFFLGGLIMTHFLLPFILKL